MFAINPAGPVDWGDLAGGAGYFELRPGPLRPRVPGVHRARLTPTRYVEVRRRFLPNIPATRGHFPTEQSALKTLYLVTRGLDPKGTGQARWTIRWKPALNAFAVTFADRMPAAENL